MPNLESKPLTTSIKFDPGHNLEMRADLAAKTAEVENLVTGEMYTGGGGDSDFSTAVVTAKANEDYITENEYFLPIIAPEGYPITNSSAALSPLVNDVDLIFVVILYKGKCVTFANEDVVISGNASFDSESGLLTITGDCTLKGYSLR